MRVGHSGKNVKRAFVHAMAFIAAWGAFVFAAHAQSATLTMSASAAEVGVGETFEIEIRAEVQNGEAGNIVQPDLSAFQIVGERTVRPMQFSFGVGGRNVMMQSTIIRHLTLVATKKGRFDIGPAHVTMGGRVVASNPLRILVAETRRNSQSQQQQQMPLGGGGSFSIGQNPRFNNNNLNPLDPNSLPGFARQQMQQLQQLQQQTQQQLQPQQRSQVPLPPAGKLDGAQFDANAFVRTVVDKKTPFVGEQVTVTIYLYVRGGLHSSPAAVHEPVADGFWTQDLLPQQRTLEGQQQGVNGVPYEVYVLRRFAAFPLHAGELTISPMTVALQTGSVFDLFGGGGGEVERAGVPYTITARELPSENRPTGEVHVGEFTIDASLDRAQAATGDAVTYRCTIKGSGNLHDIRIDAPVVDGLNFLPPQVHDTTESPGDLVGGTKTFEWLVVPQKPGTFTISGLGLNAFNPKTHVYSRVAANAVALVAAGNATTPSVPMAALSAAANADEDAHAPPGDETLSLQPIRTHSDLNRKSARIVDQRWYAGLVALFPTTFVLFLALQLIRRIGGKSNALEEDRKAKAATKGRLEAAEACAQKGDARGFYGEVEHAIKAMLAHRTGEAIGGFTHPQLRSRLVELGMSDDLAARIIDELEGSEFARFSASGGSAQEMQSCMARVQALLERIERFTKKGSAS